MEVWAILRGQRPVGTPISPAMVVIAVLVCAVSVAFWRAVLIETEHTVASQVDYEDAALCSKFGFAVGSAKHDSCKFDLLDLRHRHEDLIRQTSFP
jgi:hypothetical protein